MSQDVLASTKRIKDLQQTVFTPTKFLRHTVVSRKTCENLNPLQPKVLNQIRDQAVDTEVLRLN